MKTIFTFLSGILFSFYCFSQPEIQWQKSWDNFNYNAEGYSIKQTTDGGYILAGYNDSSINHGNYFDYWIVKLSATGIIQWEKLLGGTAEDGAQSIQQTSDGGYIIAGWSASSDGDLTGNHGFLDYWIVKLSDTGSIEWQKNFGGSNDDAAYSIQQTTDGGYIVAGYSLSTDGDVTGNHGNKDCWIVKLNATGAIEWQKTFGGSLYEEAKSIKQTTDGGYILAGYTNSINGDVTGHHGSYDYWVVKLSATGVIQWQKALGGTTYDVANSIQQTVDGGYILAGETNSVNGDVTGLHGSLSDYWIVKLNTTGVIQWQKSLGGTDNDLATSIQQTLDGDYIVAGWSKSSDGDVVVGLPAINFDHWIVSLNSTGGIKWQKVFGGDGNDGAQSIQQTSDGGYVLTGNRAGGFAEPSSCTVTKLEAYSLATANFQQEHFSIYPNPFSNTATVSFSLNQSERVSLNILDLNGRLIKNISDGVLQGGKHSLTFDGERLNTGIYLLQIQGEDFSKTEKLVFTK